MDGMRETQRTAVAFAKQQRITEKINWLLEENGREFKVVSGTKTKPSRWSREKEKDTRKWQRQYPLEHSGAIIMQEYGYQRIAFQVRMFYETRPREIVFQSTDGHKIEIFRMGQWVWALQSIYDEQVIRKARPDIIEYSHTYMPMDDWPGANDLECPTVDPFYKFMLDHPPPE